MEENNLNEQQEYYIRISVDKVKRMGGQPKETYTLHIGELPNRLGQEMLRALMDSDRFEINRRDMTARLVW